MKQDLDELNVLIENKSKQVSKARKFKEKFISTENKENGKIFQDDLTIRFA